MSRIYLKKRKNNSFWIKDILDDKKLGKIAFDNGFAMINLKPQFSNHNLANEAQYLAENNHSNWHNHYANYLAEYNSSFTSSKDCKLPQFVESYRLKRCENDMFKRKAYLHPAARKAWGEMQKTAKKDSIDLQIISAFRSLDYQKQLIENKLAKHILIDDILKVNTLPGYSEHHTGCAIDIGSKDAAILEDEFDQSNAFRWLSENANKFGFIMTYPKGNTTGICYEPWHWCFRKTNRHKHLYQNHQMPLHRA